MTITVIMMRSLGGRVWCEECSFSTRKVDIYRVEQQGVVLKTLTHSCCNGIFGDIKPGFNFLMIETIVTTVLSVFLI